MTRSMLGLWRTMYRDLGQNPVPYGDDKSYILGADWLKDCTMVEDWGCGMGFLRTLVPPDRYWGVDGTHSPFADLVVDLTQYRSQTPGLFMRHVLEHNWEWEKVLDNALASFTKRMVLILFTPMGVERTYSIPEFEGHGEIPVPSISFLHADLVRHFDGAPGINWSWVRISSRTMFGAEQIYYLEKTRSTEGDRL